MDKLQKVLIARAGVKNKQVVPLNPSLALEFDFTKSADQTGWEFKNTVGWQNTAGSKDSTHLIITNTGGGVAQWGSGMWYYPFPGLDYVAMEPGATITGSNLVKPPSNSGHYFGFNSGSDVQAENSYTLPTNSIAMGRKLNYMHYFGENNGNGAVNKIGKFTITKIYACEYTKQYIKMHTTQYAAQESDGAGSYLAGLNRFYMMGWAFDMYMQYQITGSPGSFNNGYLLVTATLISTEASGNRLRVRGATGASPAISGDGTRSDAFSVGDTKQFAGTTVAWNSAGYFSIWEDSAVNNGGKKAQWHISKITWEDGTSHTLLDDPYVP